MKRDEIETLLPCYAAGTLSRNDADREKATADEARAIVPGKVRTGDQPQDRESPRPHRAADAARPRGRGDRIETDLLQCMSPVVALIGSDRF